MSAFVTSRSGDNEVYVMAANGSTPINLTAHMAADGVPSWSPVVRTVVQSASWARIKAEAP